MARLLVVEDDSGIRKMLVDLLKTNHYQVEAVQTAEDALHYLKTYVYDLVILDRGLPDGEGLDVLKEARAAGKHMPVLMLTARGTLDDKEEGLESGADDYLTKPFQARELLARIKALLRRPAEYTGNFLNFGELRLDPQEHLLTRGGEAVKLSRSEFALLEFLMRNPNQVFASSALLDRIWEADAEPTEQAIQSCVKRLRKRIDNPDGASYIETVYGVGYKLVDPNQSH